MKVAKPKVSCKKPSFGSPTARNIVLTITETIAATSTAGIAIKDEA
jgi:hypothetical protein